MKWQMLPCDVFPFIANAIYHILEATVLTKVNQRAGSPSRFSWSPLRYMTASPSQSQNSRSVTRSIHSLLNLCSIFVAGCL